MVYTTQYLFSYVKYSIIYGYIIPSKLKYAEEGDHQIQKVVTTGRKGGRRLGPVRTMQEAHLLC